MGIFRLEGLFAPLFPSFSRRQARETWMDWGGVSPVYAVLEILRRAWTVDCAPPITLVGEPFLAW